MTRTNKWGDPPEYLAALDAGPEAFAAYNRRLIDESEARWAAARAEQEAEHRADLRRRNRDRMRAVRARAKGENR